MLKIASWNVNSIRARIVNFLDWVKEYNPDVVLLQELKCTIDQFPFLELESLNYNIEVLGQKARNGVAILSKYPLYDIKKSLPLYNLINEDEDSRFLEACFDYEGKTIKVVSVYLPNGGPTVTEVNSGIKDVTATETFRKKMIFCDRLKMKLKESIDNNEIAIYGGDYNICPNLYMDVYSPSKDGVITCTEQERQKFREFLETGVKDIWRDLNPDFKEFSWWGYRPYTMWEKNQGYRLDALLTTPEATKLVKASKIFSKETRGKEKASDHAPITCEVKI